MLPAVVNAPGNIAADLRQARDMLKDLARRPLRMEKEKRLEAIQRRDEEHQSTLLWKHDWLAEPLPELHPTYGEVAKEYVKKDAQLRDPPQLQRSCVEFSYTGRPRCRALLPEHILPISRMLALCV